MDMIQKQARVIHADPRLTACARSSTGRYQPAGLLNGSYHPELDPARYGLTVWDLDRKFVTGGLGVVKMCCRCARSLTSCDRPIRAGSAWPSCISRSPDEKRWLQERIEPVRNADEISVDEAKRRILQKLNSAEAFERFLHTKYIGHKRFSLEGGETRHPDARRRHLRCGRPGGA